MSQTANTALNLPYAYIGLGRTNNYVEDFYIGSSRWQVFNQCLFMILKPVHYLEAKNVIPNSQIIVLPYQPIGEDDPSM